MPTFLYARALAHQQELSHQLAQARAAGFDVDADHVVADHSASCISTRLCERPEGRRLVDLLRRGDTLVVRWVDLLGRNCDDVVEAIQCFIKRGIVIKTIINGFTFDGATTDPVQKAVQDSLIAFMAGTAQAQAEATKDAQRAGIAHAKANDATAYRGRKPSFSRQQFDQVQALLAAGTMNVSEIARHVGLQRMAVTRIKADPTATEAMLVNWGL